MRIRYAIPVVLVALVAGCGGSPVAVGSGQASSAATSAGSSSGAEPSASSPPAATAGGTMSAADLTTKVQAAAFAKRTATITTSAEGVTSSGVVRYGKTVEMSLTMSNGAQKMKMIMVGGAFYLDLGEKMQGKTWLRVDEKGKDPLSKAMGPLLATIRQQLNLSASASAFRGVTATSVAGATIDGASTVGYVVKLNSQQIIAALPADVRKSMASPMAGATSVSTYYVDPEWLPRKIVIVTTVKGKKTPMSVMYSNWGDPVTITAPPASDVATGMS